MEPPEEESKRETRRNKVTFVLEHAPVELGKVGKQLVILSSDEHDTFLKKHGKDPALYRPDIAHQSLLSILDSPLNKAGCIDGIYMHTTGNHLVHISPSTRIPRTFKRFCGLLAQVLQKLSVRATNGPDKLMKTVKQPVSRHLPVGSRRIATSAHCAQAKRPRDLIADWPIEHHTTIIEISSAAGFPPYPLVASLSIPVLSMILAAMEPSEHIDTFVMNCTEPNLAWMPAYICRSASCCISRFCGAFEEHMDVL